VTVLQAFRIRPFAQRWMLALALLLPMAQGAAWLHTLGHAADDAGHAALHAAEDADSDGLVQDLCELCLAAAQLSSAAPGPAAQPRLAQAPAATAPASPLPAAVSKAPFWRQGARGPPGGDVNHAAQPS
jgi:hypothetical protein